MSGVRPLRLPLTKASRRATAAAAISTGPIFSTPKEALAAMQAAGAEFTVRPRSDGSTSRYAYRVSEGGDAIKCSCIMAAVTAKPKQFGEAFRIEVARIAERIPS